MVCFDKQLAVAVAYTANQTLSSESTLPKPADTQCLLPSNILTLPLISWLSRGC